MRRANVCAIALAVLLLDASGTSSSELNAVPRGSSNPDQPTALRDLIVSKERQELDSLKAGDRRTFSDLIADDAVFVDARGAATKDAVVESTAELKLHEYSMDDIRFLPISEDAGLICYKLTEKATSHGREMAGQVYVSATWLRRKDRWACIFSQETPIK